MGDDVCDMSLVSLSSDTDEICVADIAEPTFTPEKPSVKEAAWGAGADEAADKASKGKSWFNNPFRKEQKACA
eukprot:CAMPEP_0170281184 /NCGR_PEP_ID=MMETSP0116_2-20130129/40611_1 /TAXON_ID=400756 /ORGANISM="Durinskia baltica, Strain CSIRO CS-38" /LENGTH=72 /DNA_ID=CAMNT_0010532525 /DNA_START=32 /DNA_END=246 /DNA_ORIENTATION=-